VYVYERGGSTWIQQQVLTASNGEIGDAFGLSVSASGDTVIIGAPRGSVGSVSNQGIAYVFVLSGGVWIQQQELFASDGAANDWFGCSISVDGDMAVIGAQGRNGQHGTAYVFVRNGGVWGQQQELTPTGGAGAGAFGISVSLSGNTAVIGAYGENDVQGAAYVFVQNGATWIQQQRLAASDGATEDRFGGSISLSGNTAVFGAYTKSVGSNAAQGAAYVFTRNGATWSQQQELAAPDGAEGDQFGYSVSLSGQTLMIGALFKTSNSRTGQGAAYVFESNDGLWSQAQELTPTDRLLDLHFGSSVVVSGNTALVGGYGGGENYVQGVAYAYLSALPGQTIAFGALQNEPLGAAPFAISATASSGLPVSFASLTGPVCTVSGSMVTLVAAGTCIIHATQAGNSAYAAAAPVDQSFLVTGSTQTIVFGAIANVAFGAAPFAISATASSGLPVSFTSLTTAVCTVSGSLVTLAAVGTCTIQATQPGNANYAPAAPVNQSFQVAGSTQTIVFGALANQVLGAAPFTIGASASSGLPVSFTSLTTAVCTVSGSLVTLAAVGTCTIQTTQPGNAGFAAATPVDRSFLVTAVALPTVSGVISAGAFGAYPAVAPGTWIEIYGSNLAATTATWTAAQFVGNMAPDSLGGVEVSVGGQLAYIDYVSPGQVNAQLSSNIGPGSWQLIVTSANVSSVPVNITVNAVEPGLLGPASFAIDGKQYVVAQLADDTYALPAGAIAGVGSRPARPGETIVIYGIGFGMVLPSTPAGEIAPGRSQLLGPLQVFLGQTAAQVQYAGLAPGLVGLYQFNIIVPPVPDSDLVPIAFILGDVPCAQTLYTAVHR
jgi:uncharacterized protein (TIGR03437 family)